MKKLNELYDCQYDTLIKDIKINSKDIEIGDLFICTKGVTADRHDFIEDAIKNGASALVVSRDIKYDIPTIKVDDTNVELPLLCRRFYDYPDKKLKLLGVTGTDGKTSVSTILQTLIGDKKCGYIGTNGRSCSEFNYEISNTTPDSDKLYKYFNDFVNAKCEYVAMETSSEAFFRNRLSNLKFNLSIMTNITSEHLNIHGSLENYIKSKCKLFEQTIPSGYCILNIDDKYYDTVKKHCNGQILTYGVDSNATLQIIKFKIKPDKTDIRFKLDNKIYDIESPLLGDFNVYNLCAAILAAYKFDVNINDIISKIKDIKISGRLDMIDLGQNFYIMVDYAHTPNGIERLLNFVHTLDINRSIVVIGQAGERDYLKRPIVGETVVKNASYAIFTYEDPRSENPENICKDIINNIKDKYNNYEIIIDRSEAIKKAIDIAKEKDIVLILGKGNETYEKLKDKTIYFNDIEEAIKHLERRLENEFKK